MQIILSDKISALDFKEILDWISFSEEKGVQIVCKDLGAIKDIEKILDYVKEYKEYFELSFYLKTEESIPKEIIPKLILFDNLMIDVDLEKILDESYKEMIYSNATIAKKDLWADENWKYRIFLTAKINEKTTLEGINAFSRLQMMVDSAAFSITVENPVSAEFKADKNSYYSLVKNPYMLLISNALNDGYRVELFGNQIPICYFSGLDSTYISRAIKKSPEYIGFVENFTGFVEKDKIFYCCTDNFEKDIIKIKEYSSREDLYNMINYKIQEKVENNYLPKCEKCLLKEVGNCWCGSFDFLKKAED